MSCHLCTFLAETAVGHDERDSDRPERLPQGRQNQLYIPVSSPKIEKKCIFSSLIFNVEGLQSTEVHITNWSTGAHIQ